MSNRLEVESQGLVREIDTLTVARAGIAAERDRCWELATHYTNTSRPNAADYWSDQHGKLDDKVCEIDDAIEKRRDELEAIENPPERPYMPKVL